MPNTTNHKRKRRNATNALEDLRKHKEKISKSFSDAQNEKFFLFKTLDKYSEVFDRHGLTDLVQLLKKSCIDYNYIDELIWLDNLERELQRIIMSNGAKPEREDADISHEDDSGYNCENCPDKKSCMAYAVKRILLRNLATVVCRELSDPISGLRAMIDANYALWLEISLAVLEKNGIHIIER